MKSWKGSARFIVPFFVAATWITGLIAYALLPEYVASHWDFEGTADGYLPKLIGVFLMPVLITGLAIILGLAPKIDPKKHNFAYFRNGYSIFTISVLAFLYYLFVLMILWNMAVPFSMPQMLLLAFSILFWLMGEVFSVIRQNWLIGIKTPWTLSNERVWNDTHRVGKRWYQLLAFISLISVVLHPFQGFLLVFGSAFLISMGLVMYSWNCFRTLNSKKRD